MCFQDLLKPSLVRRWRPHACSDASACRGTGGDRTVEVSEQEKCVSLQGAPYFRAEFFGVLGNFGMTIIRFLIHMQDFSCPLRVDEADVLNATWMWVSIHYLRMTQEILVNQQGQAS